MSQILSLEQSTRLLVSLFPFFSPPTFFYGTHTCNATTYNLLQANMHSDSFSSASQTCVLIHNEQQMTG